MAEQDSLPQSAPSQATKVWVYKSSRRLDTYIYLASEGEFSAIPAALKEAMGKLEFVFELDLFPGRKLARASAEAVLQAVEEKGYYLQLPPVDRPGEARVH